MIKAFFEANRLLLIPALFYLGLVSCVSTRTELSPTFGLTQTESLRLDVPFKKQDRNGCGPTALHLLVQHHGLDVPYETVHQMVFTENLKATHTFDMISAMRRLGLEPRRLAGLEELIHTLESNRPVLTLRHIKGFFHDRWHYDLVVGYDRHGASLLVHTGKNAFDQIKTTDFVDTWQASQYWGLAANEQSLAKIE